VKGSTLSNINTATRPAFRAPWTHGARAYFEADTFDAMREGMKRKRITHYVHMPHGSEADALPCYVCGRLLGEQAEGSNKVDLYSTWTWSPRHKQAVNGCHYVCSWTALFALIPR
jgi:hypothetical protein